MKPSENTRLDQFILEKLKEQDTNLPFVNWSEVEVLLKYERKPIQVKVSKKTIFISAGVTATVIVVAGVFMLVKYYSSRPAETEPEPAPSTQVLVADTQKKISPDTSHPVVIAKPDTAKPIAQTQPETDSTELTAAQEKRADSLIADFKQKEKEEKKKAEQKKPVEPKKEKKNKISSLAPTISDSENNLENILPPDTAGKNKSALKIDSPVSADSIKAKTNSKKNKKNKKGKPSTDSVKVVPAKSDSLK